MEYPDNRNWDRLENEFNHYTRLFMRMIVDWDITHWYTWRIWWKWKAKQIDLNKGREHILSPSDLWVIAIWLSLPNNDSSLNRISYQFFLIDQWVIDHNDLLLHSQEMVRRTRTEHLTRVYYTHMIENAWKVIILKKAFISLKKLREEWKLTDIEDRIILWYIVAILWWNYELRPYMVDSSLQKETWISFYDHLFEDFSIDSYEKYNQSWFGEIWTNFLDIRNDIAKKKWEMLIRRAIPNKPVTDDVREEVHELLKNL